MNKLKNLYSLKNGIGEYIKTKAVYFIIGAIGFIPLLIIILVTLVLLTLASIFSSSFPSMENGTPDIDEYLKIYDVYEKAEQKTYKEEKIHTNIPLMITVDLYLSENNFNKIDVKNVQEESDSMIAPKGYILHEDINNDHLITKEIKELEDTNKNDILDINVKSNKKQLKPGYDYVKERLEKEGKWSSFQSDYNSNMEYFLNLYKAQVYFIDKLGVLGIPIEEPYTITAGFNSEDDVHGGNHNGVDFVYTGEEIPYALATENGEVIMSNKTCPSPGGGLGDMCGLSPFLGGGNFVVIKHKVKDTVFYSLYAHMEEVLVDEGDKVEKGDRLGIEGSSGNSTGKHLHFSIFDENFNFYDPMKFLKRENN